MLDNTLVPSRLVLPEERPPILIVEPEPPSGYRSAMVLRLISGYLLAVGWSRLTRTFSRQGAARRFRELLEDLGGLWIKVGQLMSLRIDILSVEFCRELSKLQDTAHGFPGRIARRLIEKELGGPIEQYFDHFDEEPFAAASIGQLHRAHLRRENVWVAVKVQRPYLAENLGMDMKLIEWLVRVIVLLNIMPYGRWSLAVFELRHIMHEELDYRFEAAAMRRLKKTLRKHRVYVPEAFPEYTTPRILVMEFIQAALMSDFIKVFASDPVKLSGWLQENNIEPKLVARRLIHSIFRQLFEDNLYHGDLHPGNIILLRDSRIALIDFGSIGFTDREYLEKLRLFMRALATRDYAKAADIGFLLGGNLPAIDLEEVKGDTVRFLRVWGSRTHVRELPYHEKSIDHAIVGVTKTMLRYRCTVDWQFLRVRRALTTLDSALMTLLPNADYTQIIAQYFRKAERRMNRKLVGPALVPRVVASAANMMDASERLYELTFYRGSVIRRQAQLFQGATNKFAYFFAVGFGQLALLEFGLAFVLLSGFLDQYHPDVIRPWLGPQLSHLIGRLPRLDYQVWVLLIAAVVFFALSSARLRIKFAEKEARLPESRASL